MDTGAGTIDFGGGALISADPVGGSDVFVAKFDTSGKYLWSKRYGDALPQTRNAVVATKMEEIVLTGNFDGLFDFGGKPPLTNSGAKDAFLTKLLTP